MARDHSVLQIGLRVLVLVVGAGGVVLGLLFLCGFKERNALECRLADGTGLVASFEARPRCWPRFRVKTLRLACAPELVATFRLASSFPHEYEDACFYDLYLADAHPYLLRREEDSWKRKPETPGKEATGEWFELLPLEQGIADGTIQTMALLHAAADQLAALSYAPQVGWQPLGK